MDIQLSDHFNFSRLLRFVLPSIGMMVFISIYGVVDGFFISNFTGSVPFAAVNLILPYVMIFSAIGFMVGTGGTALVGMKLGEGKKEEADQIFTMLVCFVILAGIAATLVGELTLKKVAISFGASEAMLPYCILYGRISFITLACFMLQNLFQSFMVVAEKPRLGFGITIMAGLTNIVGDALLVGVFHLGVSGAALATACSELLGGLIPLFYFLSKKNKSLLHFVKPTFRGSVIGRTCFNGASEFVTNISMSVVNILYNWKLMQLAGENGVAAYGVIMYVTFIFVSVFIGYSIGSSPIVSFNFGAQNHDELRNVFHMSLKFVAVAAVCMVVLAAVCAKPLALMYVGYDDELMAMTQHAFRIYSLSFLIMGFNIYGSAFFTALNNGKISATISFMRTLLFQIIMVLVLPIFLGINGVWSSVIFAEILALIVTITFWVKMRKRYHY